MVWGETTLLVLCTQYMYVSVYLVYTCIYVSHCGCVEIQMLEKLAVVPPFPLLWLKLSEDLVIHAWNMICLAPPRDSAFIYDQRTKRSATRRFNH